MFKDLEGTSSPRVEFMNRAFGKSLWTEMDEHQVTWLKFNMSFVAIHPKLVTIIMESNLAPHLSMDQLEI
jgi:hypothetical protein